MTAADEYALGLAQEREDDMRAEQAERDEAAEWAEQDVAHLHWQWLAAKAAQGQQITGDAS